MLMRVYVSFTKEIQSVVDLLIESAEDLEDVEIIPVSFTGIIPSDLKLGDTGKESYQTLMIERWKTLPPIIQENMGSNIVWLDADCVFNSKNPIFAQTIEKSLENHDFVFQYDTNSYMSSHINTGIMGIKCSEKTLSIVNKWFDDISNTPTSSRRPGYPQLEWNEFFDKYPEYEATFHVLPKKFGYLESDCVLYHAIATSDKLGNMRSALSSWAMTS
jgi:hypothetical protein